MPRSSPKLCPRCNNLVRGRCKCSRWQPNPTRKIQTNSATWKRLRKEILTSEPLCRACGLELATDLDHITPVTQGGTDDPSNLQPLCRPCHDLKTQREAQQGRGR
jgi:5-methylcytosine-specific restriction protein A